MRMRAAPRLRFLVESPLGKQSKWLETMDLTIWNRDCSSTGIQSPGCLPLRSAWRGNVPAKGNETLITRSATCQGLGSIRRVCAGKRLNSTGAGLEASDWPLGVEGHLPGRGGGPTALSQHLPRYQRDLRSLPYRRTLSLVRELEGLLVPCFSRQGPQETAKRSRSPEIEETD
jgi:hypothetical protein